VRCGQWLYVYPCTCCLWSEEGLERRRQTADGERVQQAVCLCARNAQGQCAVPHGFRVVCAYLDRKLQFPTLPIIPQLGLEYTFGLPYPLSTDVLYLTQVATYVNHPGCFAAIPPCPRRGNGEGGKGSAHSQIQYSLKLY
jgi:hypothetical protein